MRQPNADLAPVQIIESLERYRDNGVPSGDFLQAVLENNLCNSMGRADADNLLALPDIVAWVYNRMPASAWGSPEKYRKWIERKTKEREEQRNNEG